MKQELEEIKPLEGLGPLKFGMSRDEVREIMGEPNDVDTYSFSEDGEDKSESWHYDEEQVSMSFDEDDDYRLITLAVSGEGYKLKGRALVNMSRTAVIEFLNENGITDLSFEDADTIDMPNHELISAPQLFLNVWLEKESVKEVQWSPEFTDDDEVNWPD